MGAIHLPDVGLIFQGVTISTTQISDVLIKEQLPNRKPHLIHRLEKLLWRLPFLGNPGNVALVTNTQDSLLQLQANMGIVRLRQSESLVFQWRFPLLVLPSLWSGDYSTKDIAKQIFQIEEKAKHLINKLVILATKNFALYMNT